MEKRFSNFLCGLKKNHNAQYSLLEMTKNKKKINKKKKKLDNGKKIGVINHSLLLAKLDEYGFSDQAYYKVFYVIDFREEQTIIFSS